MSSIGMDVGGSGFHHIRLDAYGCLEGPSLECTSSEERKLLKDRVSRVLGNYPDVNVTSVCELAASLWGKKQKDIVNVLKSNGLPVVPSKKIGRFIWRNSKTMSPTEPPWYYKHSAVCFRGMPLIVQLTERVKNLLRRMTSEACPNRVYGNTKLYEKVCYLVEKRVTDPRNIKTLMQKWGFDDRTASLLCKTTIQLQRNVLRPFSKREITRKVKNALSLQPQERATNLAYGLGMLLNKALHASENLLRSLRNSLRMSLETRLIPLHVRKCIKRCRLLAAGHCESPVQPNEPVEKACKVHVRQNRKDTQDLAQLTLYLQAQKQR